MGPSRTRHRRHAQVDIAKDATGREVEKLHLGAYKWMTYSELGSRVDAVAAGLVAFAGLKPQERVIIYADTKADWQASLPSASTRLPAYRKHLALLKASAPALGTRLSRVASLVVIGR